MKTNEVEKITGLSKQTILFYEREHLIQPKRDANGYRNYNQDDLQLLTLIKFLRSMNISIDDIKLIIQQKLSFQDCLQTQSEHIQQALDQIQEMKSTIAFYKEKQIPMIPALKEIEKLDDHTILGYQKTSPKVSIGRQLTKPYMIRKIGQWIFLGFIMGGACYYGYQFILGVSIRMIWPIVWLIVMCIQIMSYGLGLGELAAFSIQNNATQFIEFDESGLNYIDNQTFQGRISYMRNVLCNQESLRHVNYEHVQKVTILEKIRYMKISASPLSTSMKTYDYYFQFNDGTTYTLIQPILLDKDREMIEVILKEKVKDVVIKES